ncbi:hypothetical protein AAG747_11460 [Rapidithrix thailandica]|uniref:HNH homing endonuclease n=1 Tax=Rapidithrix thailandica TaxID=413964 RepID=A0AAW9SCB4_9BACT
MHEIWQEIDFNDQFFSNYDFKGKTPVHSYAISNWGHIKRDGELIAPRVCKIRKTEYKYLIVYCGYDKEKRRGIEVRIPLQRVVAHYFVKNTQPETLNYVTFVDEDPLNCIAWNLKWIDQSEAGRKGNMSPKRQGPNKYGKHVKLNKAKADIIRKLVSRGTRQKVIAKRFGISEMQVTRIMRGENWK